MAGINVIETIVARQVMKLPPWVRIITYFICLFALIYQILSPKFFNGEVREYAGTGYEGTYSPFPDVGVGIKAEGRPISTTSNEKGDWSLPLLDANIFGEIDLRLEFLDEEGNKKFKTVTIPRSLAFTEDIVIGYNRNTPQKFKVLNIETGAGSRPDDSAYEMVKFSWIRAGIAEEGYVEQFNAAKKRVKEEITQILGVNVNDGQVPAPVKEINFKDKMELKRKLEGEYDIKISVDEIKSCVTSDDVAHIVATKKIIQSSQAKHAYYGRFDSAGGWGERFFKVLDKDDSRVPHLGDIIEAVSPVNIRQDYSEYSLLSGWTNTPATGVIKPGEKLLVEEVKMIASDFVWIKFHSIE